MARSRLADFSAQETGLALVVCLVAVAAASCDRKEAGSTPAPEVLVAEVVQRDVPIYAEGVGTTVGNVDAQIRAKVQGYLLSRHYQEGAFVKAGDLLFKIDARTYQASFDQMKGELARAEAAYKKTQLDVARDTPLAKQGAVSQKELDDSLQANEANKASVFAAKANLGKAKLNLDWTSIVAPVDGVAGISQAQIGDLIMENTVMTTVSQLDPIKVLFPISEKMYMKFAERIQRAVAHPTGDQPERPEPELILADGTVYQHKGKVSLPDRQVDIKTGTITIVSYFPNPGNILRPGQYAKVRAVIETYPKALLIPQRAVEELQGTYRVAVVEADNKVAIRPVKPGPRVGAQWVVTEGLRPGDKVVVEGLQKVRSGLLVAPKPLPPEPTSSNPAPSFLQHGAGT